MKISPIIWLGICLVFFAGGQRGFASEKLEGARFKFETQLERIQVPNKRLKSQYEASLGRLAEKVQKEGSLERLLQIKEEKARIASDEPGAGKLPEVFAELGQQRSIYEKYQVDLLKTAAAEKESCIEAYRDVVAGLQQRFTKDGEIDAALACKKEVGELEKMLAALKPPAPTAEPEVPRGFAFRDWKAPQRGVFEFDKEMMKLAGPGTIGGAAVAFPRKPLPDGASLVGECLLTGIWAGFVLGNSQEGAPYVCVFTKPGNQAIQVELHKDGKRIPLPDVSGSWTQNKWEKFELSRKGKRLYVTVGKEKLRITIPNEVTGSYAGILSFQQSEISVRSIGLVTE